MTLLLKFKPLFNFQIFLQKFWIPLWSKWIYIKKWKWLKKTSKY